MQNFDRGFFRTDRQHEGLPGLFGESRVVFQALVVVAVKFANHAKPRHFFRSVRIRVHPDDLQDHPIVQAVIKFDNTIVAGQKS